MDGLIEPVCDAVEVTELEEVEGPREGKEYQSHFRPVLVQRRQLGLASSHFIRRILHVL
jgi:hypothetical protein